jgi:hypothetical protein
MEYCEMRAETRILEPEVKTVVKERPVNTFPWQTKHATTATDTHAIIEELSEVLLTGLRSAVRGGENIGNYKKCLICHEAN